MRLDFILLADGDQLLPGMVLVLKLLVLVKHVQDLPSHACARLWLLVLLEVHTGHVVLVHWHSPLHEAFHVLVLWNFVVLSYHFVKIFSLKALKKALHSWGLLFWLWLFSRGRFGLVVVALTLRSLSLFASFFLSRATRVEHLVIWQNLVLWDINLLEALIIKNSILGLWDNMSPLLIVSINQVLNLESDPGLKCLILAMLEQIIANKVSVVKINDLVAPFLFILEVLFGLSAKVNHELIHHIAHNFNVLIVELLL